MFTGIIEVLGRVLAVAPTGAEGQALRLTIRAQWSPSGPRWTDLAVGESIAVDGCCLTLAAPATDAESGGDGVTLAFDAVPQTLALTTLGRLRPGQRVHLERSATLATLLGGHLVQGHVDGVGTVLRVQRTDDWRVRIAPPAHLLPYLAPKGSITLAGVSLTLAEVAPPRAPASSPALPTANTGCASGGDSGGDAGGWFEVALIPTTLAKTTLADLREGDGVNLEADAIAKTVVHYLRHFPASAPPPAT
jgi:riboflavin synthase alpha subunit